ncbi:MAG: hypothetical protein ACP5HM_13905 [Anaerolineae bacterium]
MNKKLLFSGPAHVEIQGERVVRLHSREGDSVVFELIGFENPPIKIEDYRPATLRALQEILVGGDVQAFAPRFNVPAYLEIERPPNSKEIRVTLYPTGVDNPPSRLWIAVGIGPTLPVYEYLICHAEPLGDQRFALFALYHRWERQDQEERFVVSDLSTVAAV